jgi:hypothetical protein
VTPEEFLRRVAHEARQLPKVRVAANIDARAFDAQRTAQLPKQVAASSASASSASSTLATPLLPVALPADLVPSDVWAATCAASIAELRQALVRYAALQRQHRLDRVSAADRRTLESLGDAVSSDGAFRNLALPRSRAASQWLVFCLGSAAAATNGRSIGGSDSDRAHASKRAKTSNNGAEERANDDVADAADANDAPGSDDDFVPLAAHQDDDDDDEDDDDTDDANGNDENDAAAAAAPSASTTSSAQTSASAASAAAHADGYAPHLSIISRMDAVSVETALSALISYLCADDDNDDDQAPAVQAPVRRSLTPALAAWLYALLAAVGKPLHADLAASLRALHRRCAQLRALLAAGVADDAQRRSSAARLNLIMTIVDRCFQQRS